MKAKTKTIAAIVALFAVGNISNVLSQSTVAWNANFGHAGFHTVYEESVESESVLDTLSNRIYRTSNSWDESIDYDQSAAKTNRKGNVISCYDATTGKYLWANEFKSHSYYHTFSDKLKITPIGKTKGVYVVGGFAGKISYNNGAVVTSVNASTDENISMDVFIYRINELGVATTAQPALIKPKNVGTSSNLAVHALTTDVNGSLVAVFQNWSDQYQTYDLDPTAGVKLAVVGENDLLLVKYDINLKYVNHIVVAAVGNDINITNVSCDKSKNIILSGVYVKGAGNTDGIDLDGFSPIKKIQNSTLTDSKRYPIIIKYHATMAYAWHTLVNTDVVYFLEPKAYANLDGSVIFTGILHTGQEIQFNSTAKFKAIGDSIVPYIAKYSKYGAFQSAYKETKSLPSTDWGYWSFSSSLDSKGNVYMAYPMGADLFMAKYKPTGNTFVLKWKNRIAKTSGQYASLTDCKLMPLKNSLIITAYANLGKYKLQVTGASPIINVNGDNASIMCRYNLSGSALSPLDQMDENNSNAYKNDITATDATALDATIYPNPVVTNVNVAIAGEMEGIVNAEVYNLNGQKMLQLTSETPNFEIPTSTLPNGIYLLNISNGLNLVQKKFVKTGN
ncbi:MAG: T9SS type A sorting domain-containing protein [Bacteroidetes bacterium]|nr:T9SS type A sorting domain-containing protein [Bacteroidota bacterium]